MSFSHRPVSILSDRPKNFAEDIILRITMPQMLPVTLRVRHTARPAAFGSPIAPRLNVLVHAMMFHQPVTLAGMAGEHLGFGVDDTADVDAEAGWDRLARRVFAFDGVAVVDVGNVR